MGVLILWEFFHFHQGIIHNDVKSSNLLLSSGVLKIADFGKSMFLADFTSSMMGTLNYTAPEVARAYLQGQKSGPFVTYGIDVSVKDINDSTVLF